MACMRRASQVVAYFSKKYDCNRFWLWEILDNHFNMRRGQAAMMDSQEVIAFQDLIEDFLDE